MRSSHENCPEPPSGRHWAQRRRGRWGRRRRHFEMRHVVFRWLVAMALALSVIMPALSYVLLPDYHPLQTLRRARSFVSAQIGAAFDDPAARQRVLDQAAASFDARLVLTDRQGQNVASAGAPCSGARMHTEIRDQTGARLGDLSICLQAGHPHLRMLVAILVVMAVLWFVAGRIARRISLPLSQLSQVAQRIGGGDFSARTRKARHRVREIRELASTLDDMADRLSHRQQEQRELLAAVSHELRSPLTRMRVALEIAEQRREAASLVASLQAEITSADKLVGDMLSNARLDFQDRERAPLQLADLARAILARRQAQRGDADVPLLLDVPDTTVLGDTTLLTRALDNLLDNAEIHGAGIVQLHLHAQDGLLWVDVHDRGPGFAADAMPHVFKSFYRSARGGVQGLGLGLSLVQRIAQAHGGHARARNLTGTGACVGIGLPPAGSVDR